MNKAFLIGNLTRDPELRSTGSGISMCQFGLAVNRRRKSTDGQPDVDFFNIICFRQLADNVMRFMKKGSKVCVVGQIQIRSYDAQDGTKRTVVDIVADDIEFMPRAQQQEDGYAAYAPPSATPPAPKPFAAETGFTEVDEDELPF